MNLKQLPIIIASLLLGIFLNAQDYKKFDFQNSEWIEAKASHEWNSHFGRPDYHIFRYFIDDSINIDGKFYHKLFMEKLCIDKTNGNNVSEFDSPINYLGGLREEDKKIYYYRDYSDTINLGDFKTASSFFGNKLEHLLFDFNLEVGDTIFYTSNNYFIKTGEETGFHGLKVHNFYAHYMNSSWIESIGGNTGLFGSLDAYLKTFRCFKKMGDPFCHQTTLQF